MTQYKRNSGKIFWEKKEKIEINHTGNKTEDTGKILYKGCKVQITDQLSTDVINHFWLLVKFQALLVSIDITPMGKRVVSNYCQWRWSSDSPLSLCCVFFFFLFSFLFFFIALDGRELLSIVSSGAFIKMFSPQTLKD